MACGHEVGPCIVLRFARRWCLPCLASPGLMDIQINGAYGFDFSVYEGDEEAYRQGLKTVAEKIVETGVTSCVVFY